MVEMDKIFYSETIMSFRHGICSECKFEKKIYNKNYKKVFEIGY
jgi:hypothetical protein